MPSRFALPDHHLLATGCRLWRQSLKDELRSNVAIKERARPIDLRPGREAGSRQTHAAPGASIDDPGPEEPLPIFSDQATL
jgi:hypothetical protein